MFDDLLHEQVGAKGDHNPIGVRDVLLDSFQLLSHFIMLILVVLFLVAELKGVVVLTGRDNGGKQLLVSDEALNCQFAVELYLQVLLPLLKIAQGA